MGLDLLIFLLSLYIIYLLFLMVRERLKAKNEVYDRTTLLITNTLLVLTIFLVIVVIVLLLGFFGGYDIVRFLSSSFPLLFSVIGVAFILLRIKYTRSQQRTYDLTSLILVSGLLVLSVLTATIGALPGLINVIITGFLIRKARYFKHALYIVLILSAYRVYPDFMGIMGYKT